MVARAVRKPERKEKTSFLRLLVPHSECANLLYLAVMEYGKRLERKYHEDMLTAYQAGNNIAGDLLKKKRIAIGEWTKETLETIRELRELRFKEEHTVKRKYRPAPMELPSLDLLGDFN